AVPELRPTRADAAPAFGADLARQQLALFHRRRWRRRWQRRRLAAYRPALPIAEGGAFRADATTRIVHDEARRALPHLVGYGEGVAGIGLRPRTTGGLRRRRHHPLGSGDRRVRRHHADAVLGRQRLADIGERPALRD